MGLAGTADRASGCVYSSCDCSYYHEFVFTVALYCMNAAVSENHLMCVRENEAVTCSGGRACVIDHFARVVGVLGMA